jgi:hypothetical protein
MIEKRPPRYLRHDNGFRLVRSSLSKSQQRMLRLLLTTGYCHRARHTWDIRSSANGSITRTFVRRVGMALLRYGLLELDRDGRYLPTEAAYTLMQPSEPRQIDRVPIEVQVVHKGATAAAALASLRAQIAASNRE